MDIPRCLSETTETTASYTAKTIEVNQKTKKIKKMSPSKANSRWYCKANKKSVLSTTSAKVNIFEKYLENKGNTVFHSKANQEIAEIKKRKKNDNLDVFNRNKNKNTDQVILIDQKRDSNHISSSSQEKKNKIQNLIAEDPTKLNVILEEIPCQKYIQIELPENDNIFARKLSKKVQKKDDLKQSDIEAKNYREKMIDLFTKNNDSEKQNEKKPISINQTSIVAQNKSVSISLQDVFFDQEVLSKYNVRKCIGKGSFAKVRVAFDKKSLMKFAIKTYVAESTLPFYSENIKNEIKILKKIDHPRIVKIFEVITTQHHINLVLEFIEGETLSNFLEKQHGKILSEEFALKVLKQLIEIVNHCHLQRIYHRDLKLSNMIINRNNELFLIDFGFAVQSKKDGLLNSYCGTLHYLAPEIVINKPYFGAFADVWSIGVIFYRLLTGYYPFKGLLISFKPTRCQKINIRG